MSGKIRVLLVTGSYPPMRCGVGDYTARLAQAISENGAVEIQVLTSRIPMPANFDPPWVRRIMPSWRISALPQFIAAYRAFQPDIVHLQFPTQGYRTATGLILMLFLARWLFRKTVVETWHEYPPRNGMKAVISMWLMAVTGKAVVYVRPDYPTHLRGMLARALRSVLVRFIPNASVIPAVELSQDQRRTLRSEAGCGDRFLVAFFGFAHPNKGVEQLFEIADPNRHQLLLIGELSETDPYHRKLRALAESDAWRGKVTFIGFAEPERAARLLAASDAAIFPFLDGGGAWNSSLHAALSQGTFTIVTSRERSGYSAEQNVYYACPSGVAEMREALNRHAGVRLLGSKSGGGLPDQWGVIANAHMAIYGRLLQRSKI